jgi:hypothetical protein
VNNDDVHDPKWTEHQRCPQCGREAESCDWCPHCEIDLLCAQGPEGLAAATRTVDDIGQPVLILARG